MRRWGYILVLALMAFVSSVALAKDISARTISVMRGVMAPYASGNVPQNNEDAPLVNAALKILQAERLVNFANATPPSNNEADRLGQALIMGRRTQEFLPELAAVHRAVTQRDDKATTRAIQTLYERMGRKKPEGAALAPLLAAAKRGAGDNTPSERIIIKKPDHTITMQDTVAAGQAFIEVIMDKGPDGKPARVTFEGDVDAAPASDEKGFVDKVTPTAKPNAMTHDEAADLRGGLNGKWFDQNGVPYEISGAEGRITVTELPGDKPARPYTGSYKLGRIDAALKARNIDDIGDNLPAEVRRQLVSMGHTFHISLLVSEDGEKLDGTWTSQEVTYSGMTLAVLSVQDPYDVKLTLTRGGVKTAMGASESALP